MSISQIKGKNVPIHMWAPVHEVESDAIDQLRNIAALPWVYHHVAVMPDVHVGKGCTVGSVVAMKDAISPSAVGVDIGCFHGDVEVLGTDGHGYKFSELANSAIDVFAYDKESQSIVVAKATCVKTRSNAELIEVKLDSGESIKCTPDHEFMMRDGRYVRADQLLPGDSLMPCYILPDKDGYLLIKQPYSAEHKDKFWATAVHRMVFEAYFGPRNGLTVHHVNGKKTDNCPDNLEAITKSGHSSLHVGERKEAGTWHWQNEDFETKRKSAIAAKAATADGYKFFADRGIANLDNMFRNPEAYSAWRESVKNHGEHGKASLIEYNKSSKAKQSASLPKAYKCVLCGVAIKSPSLTGYHYQRKHKRELSKLGENHKVVSVCKLNTTSDVYCLTVPKYHNFALNTGVFVHNCGMCAVKTSLDAHKVERKLKDIFSDIESTIPVGFNGHTETIVHNRNIVGERLYQRAKNLYEDFKNLDPHVQGLIDKSSKQIGTLGGGNHFGEVCLDTDKNVWLMLHSGSRNIGKELAEIHITKAKELTHNKDLPDKDLAVFLAGTPEMQRYRHDLTWAQTWAALNRDVMMRLFKNVMEEYWPGVKYDHEVNCHHNYVSEEIHYGENVMVTRKGAISAKTGEMGIIPGSMGTCSYIVRGLGNEESFHSASHGAGRRMSRGKAKAKFTREDLIEQTEGVMCRKDTGVLDEIPKAYKDIGKVMANQADLVEVVAEIKQILCVKG